MSKRKLDADGFHDFNIYLDVKNIERDITSNGLNAYHDLFIDSMKNAVKTIQSLLKVKPLDKEYYFSNANIESLNIRDWDKSIVGDSASYNGVSMNSLGINLIIFIKFFL